MEKFWFLKEGICFKIHRKLFHFHTVIFLTEFFYVHIFFPWKSVNGGCFYDKFLQVRFFLKLGNIYRYIFN
jgi:hypothetical protein